METIAQIQLIAKDDAKRDLLVQDEAIMAGLILVLSNPDAAVVKGALDTIILLANRADRRDALRRYLGLQEQLECLSEGPNVEAWTRELAGNLLGLLKIDDTPVVVEVESESRDRRKPRRRNSVCPNFLGGAGKMKTVVLLIHGLVNQPAVDSCRQCLLQLPGVISITFLMEQSRCVLRVKATLEPLQLGDSLRYIGFKADNVVRDEGGTELLVPFDVPEQQGLSQPSYLDDSADLEIVDDGKLLKRKSTGRSRPHEGNWLEAAANFISNSLFW